MAYRSRAVSDVNDFRNFVALTALDDGIEQRNRAIRCEITNSNCESSNCAASRSRQFSPLPGPANRRAPESLGVLLERTEDSSQLKTSSQAAIAPPQSLAENRGSPERGQWPSESFAAPVSISLVGEYGS